jgi:hypothetical protein
MRALFTAMDKLPCFEQRAFVAAGNCCATFSPNAQEHIPAESARGEWLSEEYMRAQIAQFGISNVITSLSRRQPGIRSSDIDAELSVGPSAHMR